MTRERSDRDLDAAIKAWMSDVAPPAVPTRVLEEAFARTMAAGQVRVYPWERLTRRAHRPGRVTALSLVATAALIVVALGFGVLGGGSGVGPAPSPTPSATPVPSGSPAGSSSPSAAAQVPIPIVPTASVALVGPTSLATDGKVVWALSGTGLVTRIDPASNTAGPSVQLGATTDLYNGIAVDGNGVWATDSDTSTVYRVDPTTLKVVAKIPVPTPKGVLATGTAVWVAAVHDGAVIRIDPATNKVVATITVGPVGTSGPNWLGSGLGSIWVGVPNASSVVRIDPVTNAIQATIAVAGTTTPCGSFAITAAAVWIPSCDVSSTMARIDPATNTVVAVVDLGGKAYTPAVIDGAPWVSLETPTVPGALARVAAATNAVDLELSPGGDFGGGGDLVVAAGSAWVIDGGHDRVLRLPLAAFAPG